jgi:hypothetical protein
MVDSESESRAATSCEEGRGLRAAGSEEDGRGLGGEEYRVVAVGAGVDGWDDERRC